MASRIFSNLKVLDLISVETILVGFSLGARGLALSNDINDITAGSLLRTLAPQGPALFACCSVLISISCLIILFHSQHFCVQDLRALKIQCASEVLWKIRFNPQKSGRLSVSLHWTIIWWFPATVLIYFDHSTTKWTRHAKIVDTALIFGVEGVCLKVERDSFEQTMMCKHNAWTMHRHQWRDCGVICLVLSAPTNSCTSPPWHDMLHWSLVLTVCSHYMLQKIYCVQEATIGEDTS